MTMPETPQSTPPGWYPDNQGRQRWWDGTAWTDQYQTSPAPPATTAAAPTKTSAIGWIALGLAVVALVLGFMAPVAWLAWVLGVPALVLAIVALVRRGRKLVPAIALPTGLVAGIVALVVVVAAAVSSYAPIADPDLDQPAAPTPESQSPTQTLPPEQPVTFSGDGQVTTATQQLRGGDYVVTWTTKGNCYYSADINGSILNEAFSATAATSGTNHVHDIPGGGVYLKVITGPAPSCGWTATFTPE